MNISLSLSPLSLNIRGGPWGGPGEGLGGNPGGGPGGGPGGCPWGSPPLIFKPQNSKIAQHFVRFMGRR